MLNGIADAYPVLPAPKSCRQSKLQSKASKESFAEVKVA